MEVQRDVLEPGVVRHGKAGLPPAVGGLRDAEGMSGFGLGLLATSSLSAESCGQMPGVCLGFGVGHSESCTGRLRHDDLSRWSRTSEVPLAFPSPHA